LNQSARDEEAHLLAQIEATHLHHTLQAIGMTHVMDLELALWLDQDQALQRTYFDCLNRVLCLELSVRRYLPLR
jgi:hypothetical protein